MARAGPGALARQIGGELERLWGVDPAGARGVLHVCSAARFAQGALRVLRIGPESPASERDRLALGAARARADWILATGRILRAEPELTHALHPSPARAAALAAWRRDCVGRARPPRSAVLTRGAGLDPAHPLFAAREPVLLLVPRGCAGALPRALRGRCEVAELAQPGIRGALAALAERTLRARPDAPTLLVEAGPATAAALYRAPCRVDELLLSVCEAALAPEHGAGALPPEPRLAALLGPPRFVSHSREASGDWSFLRYRRDAEAGPSG